MKYCVNNNYCAVGEVKAPFAYSECGKGYSCNYRFRKRFREEHHENTLKQ